MSNPDIIRTKIEQLIQQKGLSLNNVSLMMGVGQTYMFQYIYRKVPKRLKEEHRKKLATILNVPEQELTDLPLNNESPEMVPIEIIDASASCGKGIQNFNPVPIGKYLISFKNLKEITASAPENIKIIRARGDSMEPTINDSDVIWVDISYRGIDGDGIYLFRSGSQLLAKRVRVNLIDGSVVISSDNKKYEPFSANKVEDIVVIGKVISINKMLG